MSFSEYPIHIDQLVVGLYVRLDEKKSRFLSLRKGFKIKSEEQIEKIKNSGLTHVTCVLNKSDRLPIPVGAEGLRKTASPAAKKKGDVKPKAKTPISDKLFGLKQETIEQNKARRQQLNKCEKRYDESVSQVAVLLRRVSGRSDEAVEQAAKVVNQLVDTFLSERDVFVNLMSNKPKEEKQHLHSFNVTVLSMMLGKELKLKNTTMQSLGMGAMFHDVGKGRVPISEMSMGKATTMKYAVQRHYELHPQSGSKIVADLPSYPMDSVQVVLQHHELMDGNGFPARLKGKAIAPLARVVSVADAYDNLCNKGEDKEAFTPHEALRHMFTKMRSKLDNGLLAMFIRNLGVYPPGTLVQLSNGAIGMVISTNMAHSARPGILIYHPDIPKREALVVDLTIESDLEIKKTLRPEELPREVFAYLSPTRQINYYAEVAGE